jgi:SAM-dependent methyltransferase
MDNDFYIRFENRFRGPRDVIKRRLDVYWPIIQPLKTLYPENKVLDLGCGRGEWLEFLKEKGWPALGVDLNSALVDCCKSFGLEAEQAELLHYVFSLPDESQTVISGFHIAEHLAFDDLNRLVHEAFRVLKPGGILILETPNPENIIVGSCSFYNDPTHRHPLPPSLMAFLAEEAAFSTVITLRLNGNEGILAGQQGEEIYAAIVQLFLGQPDYALVAQKEPGPKDVELFEYLKDVGHIDTVQALSLEEKIQKVGQSIQARWEQLEFSVIAHALEQFEPEMEAARSGISDLDRCCHQLQLEAEAGARMLKRLEAELAVVRLDKADLGRYCRRLESEFQIKVQAVEQQRRELEEAVQTAHGELNSLLGSTSWRATRPLRVIKQILVKGVKWPIKKIIVFGREVLSRNQAFKSFAVRQVARFPGLENRLRRIDPKNAPSVPANVFVIDAIQTAPMAEKVYQDLKRAIENVRGKI